MGFKGGLASFTDSFMRSMEAGNERKRLETERAEQKARQDENDKWTREQRDAERKSKAEAEDVKQKLSSAAGPITEDVAQHGPSMDGQPLPGIKQTRNRTLGEQLDATADVYASKGNLPEALKYRELSAADQARRSIQAFGNLQASVKGATPDQLIDQAIQIFNNDPTLAHIENKRPNPDGTYTMDIFNKKTGQRTTQTFKPEEIMTGLRMHYDQAGALLQQAEETKRGREIKSAPAGSAIYDGNGNLKGYVPKLADVGGIKPGKMDDFVKRDFENADRGVKDAQDHLDRIVLKAEESGMTESSPAVAQAKHRVQAAKKTQLQTQIKHGAIAPEQLASEILNSASSAKEVMASLSQLLSLVGPEYADGVASLVRQSDRWSALSQK